MPKIDPAKRLAAARTDADAAAYAAKSLAAALDAGDYAEAAEAAKVLEAVGCRARRAIKAATA